MKNIKKKMKRLFYLRVAVLMTFFLGLCFAFSPLPVQAARLFGVTGDALRVGSDNPETLFVLDQGNATSTVFLELGAGDSGETIAFNPDDGLLYHLSGELNKIFESIDPITLEITPITLSGVNYNEVRAATYDTLNDVFFLVDISRSFFSLSLSLTTDGTVGTVTKLGRLDPSNRSKGLAFVGDTLYSVSRDDNFLRAINPLNGTTIPDSKVPITLPGFTVSGANGLATTHPDTGVLWALLKADDGNGVTRRLVTIDPTPRIVLDPDTDEEILIVDAVDVGSTGNTGNRFAGIAFDTTSEFSTFTFKKAMVKFNHILNNDEFMVEGKFVLGEDSNDIDPFNEEVIVKVGTSSIEIPPASFEYGGPGIYEFKGTIDGAHIKVKIVETDFGFVFMAEGKGFDLTGTPNPVNVVLVIGNDIGQSSIRLEGELNSWGKGKKRKKHHGDDDSSDDHKKWKKWKKYHDDDDSSGHKKWKKLKKWKKHQGNYGGSGHNKWRNWKK